MRLEEFLTARQVETLRAAVDRLIPADDYPSGWEAGVGSYFAQLFAREDRFLPVYAHGLDALDAEAQAAAHRSFAELAPDQQDLLLTGVETGLVNAVWTRDPSVFFAGLLEQTMEGFYADPGNGGNADGVAWDMIGYRMTA